MSQCTTATMNGPANKDDDTIVTGPEMHMTEANTNWMIEQFDVIMADPSRLINRQKIEVPLQIGDDCPTLWTFYLSYDESDQSVQINFALEKYPDGRTICTSLKLTVIFNNNTLIFNLVCHKMSTVSQYGCGKIIEKREWKHPQLGSNNFEGSVKCTISMKAYANWVDNNAFKIIPDIAADTTNRKRLNQIDADGASQLLLDIAKIYKSGGSNDVLSDFRIVTNDGIEFPVHKAILAARSTVFHAMFHSTVTENQAGVLMLKDVSSSALDIVLHYVYTGKFHPGVRKLSHDGNITAEIVSASDKYQLTILRDYFNEIFGDKFGDKGLANPKQEDKKKKGKTLSRRTQQKRCCLQ